VSDESNPPSRGARGVVREIDEQLNRLGKREKQIEDERARLLAARAALTGQTVLRPHISRRVTQDEIAAYLADNPGSKPAEIARALGVPATNIATHLHRAKDTRFTRLQDGWHLHSRTGS
jgi:DNA-directed RNA polymerase specialized sigma24 family protein